MKRFVWGQNSNSPFGTDGKLPGFLCGESGESGFWEEDCSVVVNVAGVREHFHDRHVTGANGAQEWRRTVCRFDPCICSETKKLGNDLREVCHRRLVDWRITRGVEGVERDALRDEGLDGFSVVPTRREMESRISGLVDIPETHSL